MLVKVNYCFQCGRPVGSQAVKCLYCAAPTRRIIRPERRCPYCDEPIRHKALKCVHCGEFLDGRPREQKAIEAKPAQPTFVIEKAIINAGRSLPGGGPITDPNRMIGGQSPGIEEERPKLFGKSEPQGLPAPQNYSLDDDEPLPLVGEGSEEDVLDVEANPSGAGGATVPAVIPKGSGSRELIAQRDRGAQSPAVVQSGGALPPALVSIFKKIRGMFSNKPAAEETLNIVARSEEENYRTCGMCQTEILAADNFCFHCGQQYSMSVFSWGASKRKAAPNSNFFIYVLVVICLAALVTVGPLLKESKPDLIKPIQYGAAGAAPFFSLVAFLRASGIFSRMVSLLMLALSGGVVYLWFFVV